MAVRTHVLMFQFICTGMKVRGIQPGGENFLLKNN